MKYKIILVDGSDYLMVKENADLENKRAGLEVEGIQVDRKSGVIRGQELLGVWLKFNPYWEDAGEELLKKRFTKMANKMVEN